MGEASLWSHRVVLPADQSSVARAREFARRALIEHDQEGLVEDVVLVASELATLAISGADQAITLTLVRVEDSLVLTVRYGAPLVDVRRAMRTRRVVSVTESAAQGLAVVSLVSRGCGINVDADGVESAWASFDTDRRER
jgi:anti-sigma regulatory factor (Ser/Thr protein kinase)